MPLMQSFIESQGQPIVVGGCTTYWTYLIPVAGGDIVRLRFRSFVRDPVQGLAVDCDESTGRIGTYTARKFELWTDTAPELVEMEITKAKPQAAVAIFNIWGDQTHSPMLYRLNDAGVQATEGNDGTVILRCSDGVGPADFEDLVVEVSRTPAARLTTQG